MSREYISLSCDHLPVFPAKPSPAATPSLAANKLAGAAAEDAAVEKEEETAVRRGEGASLLPANALKVV